MQRRTLGDGLEVSALGYGCMGLSHAYGTAKPKDEGIRIIRENFEMGFTYFDTAPLYVGEYADGSIALNEDLVGEALEPIRDQVVISTKFGNTWGADGNTVQDSSPAKIREELEQSLRLLRTDHIDLYYQHTQDLKVEPEVVAETVAELIREGKVLHFGLSNCSMDYIRRANAVCKVAAVQDRYSMMARDVASRFDEMEALGIGLVAYSPLANGFLASINQEARQFDDKLDFRSAMPQYSKEGREQSRPLVELLRRLSEEKQATPAQVSLAWMLGKRPWIVPIPSSSKTERNRENAGGADITLTAAEVTEIDRVLDATPMSVFGGKASAEVQAAIK